MKEGLVKTVTNKKKRKKKKNNKAHLRNGKEKEKEI